MLGLALPIAIVLALILINGIFAMAEIALVSSRRYRLQQMAEDGSAGAKAALQLHGESTRFFSTVQVGITLVTILYGSFGEAQIGNQVEEWLFDAGLSQGWSSALSTAIVVLVIGYFAIVLGELVPKSIGLAVPEPIASRVALPMTLLSRAASPVVALLGFSSNAIVRLLGIAGTDRNVITEEEIRIMIGQSAESGSVDEEEAELLDRVFHFGDRRVHEVMVPRTETVFLPRGATVREFHAVFEQTPHSRFPVFDDSPDYVVGVLGIKQVLRAMGDGRIQNPDTDVTFLMHSPYFVPESKPIDDLFREMQATGEQMAVAVDEHGGTAGIVTLEQLIEEMLGPVGDELRKPEAEVQAIDERNVLVDGSLSVDEAREELGLNIPEGNYDTIAGFVLSSLGRIPSKGDQLTVDDHRITVVEMRAQKIEVLQVTRA